MKRRDFLRRALGLTVVATTDPAELLRAVTAEPTLPPLSTADLAAIWQPAYIRLLIAELATRRSDSSGETEMSILFRTPLKEPTVRTMTFPVVLEKRP